MDPLDPTAPFPPAPELTTLIEGDGFLAARDFAELAGLLGEPVLG